MRKFRQKPTVAWYGVKKNNDTPQKSGAAPYISIPLEVAQDSSLSDGAILLFGEIYGIQRAYGRCFASDAHFQTRRGKGRSTIQRQIMELCAKGHLLTFTDGVKRRELRVAEQYLGGKDRGKCPENETVGHRPPVDGCPENEKKSSIPCLINEKATASPCPKNGAHKTPESKIKNQEKKTTPSPSSGVVLDFKLSAEQDKQLGAAIRVVVDGRNETDYKSLFLQASERGRLDAWEMALNSTQKARLKSGHMKSPPIAYFRKVLMECWQLDCRFLRDQAEKQFQAKAAVSHPSAEAPKRHVKRSASNIPIETDEDIAYEKCSDEGLDTAVAIGDMRSLSPFSVTAASHATTSKSAASVHDALFARLPADRRDEIVSRAKAIVKKDHPAFWSHGESKPGCLRLLTSICKSLLAQEGP